MSEEDDLDLPEMATIVNDACEAHYGYRIPEFDNGQFVEFIRAWRTISADRGFANSKLKSLVWVHMPDDRRESFIAELKALAGKLKAKEDE